MTGRETGENAFPGPREAERLRVHSFAPAWPRACIPASSGLQSLLGRPPGETSRLRPRGACAWPEGKLLFGSWFPPSHAPHGHPEASWSFRALSLCQGLKREKNQETDACSVAGFGLASHRQVN